MNTTVTALVALQDRRLSRDDRGATATEYALLLAFIAVVIIVAVALFGSSLNSLLSSVASSV